MHQSYRLVKIREKKIECMTETFCCCCVFKGGGLLEQHTCLSYNQNILNILMTQN